MEVVIKEASRLLGDCKAGNIVKVLKKLKEKDLEALEATIRKQKEEIGELKISLALKKDHMHTYEALRLEALGEIKETVGHPGNVLNKVRLFNKYIDKDVKLFLPKVITILHGYHKKMEAAMAEVRMLISVTTGESSRTPPPVQKETPFKEKNLDEIRTPLPQQPGRGAVEERLGEVLAAEFAAPASSELLVPESLPVPIPEPSLLPVPQPRPTPEVAPKMKSPTLLPRKSSLYKKKECSPIV